MTTLGGRKRQQAWARGRGHEPVVDLDAVGVAVVRAAGARPDRQAVADGDDDRAHGGLGRDGADDGGGRVGDAVDDVSKSGMQNVSRLCFRG